MNGRSIHNEYLSLYSYCKEFNCLPYEGGWLDQPAIYIESFEIIADIINQYQKERRNVDG